jgi:hypothetical protein
LVIAWPPSDVGAVNAIDSDPLPGVMPVIVGASALSNATTPADTPEYPLVPEPLVAAT